MLEKVDGVWAVLDRNPVHNTTYHRGRGVRFSSVRVAVIGMARRIHMKFLPLRFTVFAVLLSLSTLASAQNQAQPNPQKSSVATSDAQISFGTLKSLAGEWEGPVTTDPPQPEFKPEKGVHVSMRVTSRGHAIVHELQEAGTPLDPTRYDHPVTMLYLDGDRLALVHYCDAGNRPHMVARPAANGKTVEFDFVDVSGSKQYGYMYHAVFTMIDANHHVEDWTFMMPGDKPVRAHFDLYRAK